MRRIGVEIGGTKLQAALGESDGTIHRLERTAAQAENGRDAILTQIVDLVESVRGQESVERIGIGFGGPVDVSTGSIIKSHQVAGWSDFGLKAWAEKTFALPCVVENDSNCAGLAEATVGAGAGARTVFYMNIGSGIGGAFVVDGTLYTTDVGASEIGHTLVWNPSEERYTVLESMCSGWAMQKRARRLVRDNPDSLLLGLANGNVERIDGTIIGKALGQNDTSAVTVVQEACRSLAVALANMIALLNPRKIVIGGGISLMGQPFFGLLESALTPRIFKPYQGRQQVFPAALGEDVVLTGTLLL